MNQKLHKALQLESKGVTILGSSNMDYVSIIDEFPREGSHIVANKFFKNPGGKGANQAIMISKLDSIPRHVFVTAVGHDSDGTTLLKYYSRQNLIDPVKHTHVMDTLTSTAQIMVDSHGKNCIIVTPGANNGLNLEHFQNSLEDVKKTKVFITVLEISVELACEALRLCRENSIFTILNPTPARNDFPDSLFKNCDLICLNETEVEVICGVPCETERDHQLAFENLKKRGVGSVILTLGGRGSVYFDKNGEKTVFEAQKVKVKDTTGAGDCFIGSVAYFLSCGVEITLSIKLATMIAGTAVQKEGASEKYPTRSELLKLE
jgi:ribokinase